MCTVSRCVRVGVYGSSAHTTVIDTTFVRTSNVTTDQRAPMSVRPNLLQSTRRLQVAGSSDLTRADQVDPPRDTTHMNIERTHLSGWSSCPPDPTHTAVSSTDCETRTSRRPSVAKKLVNNPGLAGRRCCA